MSKFSKLTMVLLEIMLLINIPRCASINGIDEQYKEALDNYTYLKLRYDELRYYYLNKEISDDTYKECLDELIFDIRSGVNPRYIKVLDYICYPGSLYESCDICDDPVYTEFYGDDY